MAVVCDTTGKVGMEALASSMLADRAEQLRADYRGALENAAEGAPPPVEARLIALRSDLASKKAADTLIQKIQKELDGAAGASAGKAKRKKKEAKRKKKAKAKRKAASAREKKGVKADEAAKADAEGRQEPAVPPASGVAAQSAPAGRKVGVPPEDEEETGAPFPLYDERADDRPLDEREDTEDRGLDDDDDMDF